MVNKELFEALALLEKEKGKYYFEFDVKEIVRANIKERYEAYKIAKEIGLKTLKKLLDSFLNCVEAVNFNYEEYKGELK